MFARDLLRLLLASIASAGCSAQGADFVVPGASGSPVLSTAEPAASLALPEKDPKESVWEVDGAYCMPNWATETRDPHWERKSCGVRPGNWSHSDNRFYGGTDLDVALSAKQSGSRGGVACCYRTYNDYYEGRPVETAAGARLVAAARGRKDWSTNDLALAADSALADEWLRSALAEHASIASFARLSIELAGLGAPAALIRAAHEAALDEIEHARVSFEVARALGASSAGPGPLDLRGAAPLAQTHVELAEATLRLGCIGETLAALDAHERSLSAPEPIARILRRIADDEARHAALAFRIVAWTLRGSQGARVEVLARAATRDELPPAARVVLGPALRGLVDAAPELREASWRACS